MGWTGLRRFTLAHRAPRRTDRSAVQASALTAPVPVWRQQNCPPMPFGLVRCKGSDAAKNKVLVDVRRTPGQRLLLAVPHRHVSESLMCAALQSSTLERFKTALQTTILCRRVFVVPKRFSNRTPDTKVRKVSISVGIL